MEKDTITLYRPTGQNELKLVKKSNFTKWPPRLPDQQIFYPVTNEQYAIEIAIRWNLKERTVNYVTKFEVKKKGRKHFKIETVGAAHHPEWWIPADRLEELNKSIVGKIEVIGEYRKDTIYTIS
jgi:hypothetical protein